MAPIRVCSGLRKLRIVSQIERHITLPPDAWNDAKQLWEECASYDRSGMPFNSDSSLNNHPGLDSHYLAYQEGTLVSYLQLFHPQAREVEMTGCTKPERRKEGHFASLLRAADCEIGRFPKISRRILLVDGDSKPGASFLRHLGAELIDSEQELELPLGAAMPPVDSRLRVAPITPDDVDTLARLSAVIFEEEYAEAVHGISSCVDAPGRIKYKAIVDGQLVGFGGLSWEDGRASIFGVGIDPEVRRRGFGRGVVAAIVREAQRRLPGDTRITLEVSETNSGARQLYESLGFRFRSRYDYYDVSAIAFRS